MRQGKYDPWQKYLELCKAVIEVMNRCVGSISDDSIFVKEELANYGHDTLTKDSVKPWMEINNCLEQVCGIAEKYNTVIPWWDLITDILKFKMNIPPL